jgi:hypothetical protein
MVCQLRPLQPDVLACGGLGSVRKQSMYLFSLFSMNVYVSVSQTNPPATLNVKARLVL